MIDDGDRLISETVERGAPRLRPEVRARALEAMAQTTRLKKRSRKGLVAIAAGAAVAFAGLGFVPFPAGSAKGALDRAMAATRAATGIFMEYQRYADGLHQVTRKWATRRGQRLETWQDGKLVHLEIETDTVNVTYDPAQRAAYDFDQPPPRPKTLGYIPDRDYVSRVLALYETRRSRMRARISEWRERSLWRGEREVVEVENGALAFKKRYELDPESGRVMSETSYVKRSGAWRLSATAAVEWDVEIPDSMLRFDPPAGTTLHRSRWWTGRADHVIASGQTDAWQVTVHAIDVDENGNLYLTLSRTPTQHGPKEWNGGIPIGVEAIDNLAAHYAQENDYACSRDYWVTTLDRHCRGESREIPRFVSLTMYPYPDGPDADQSVTLRNLPLPARQKKADLRKGEVIHY